MWEKPKKHIPGHWGWPWWHAGTLRHFFLRSHNQMMRLATERGLGEEFQRYTWKKLKTTVHKNELVNVVWSDWMVAFQCAWPLFLILVNIHLWFWIEWGGLWNSILSNKQSRTDFQCLSFFPVLTEELLFGKVQSSGGCQQGLFASGKHSRVWIRFIQFWWMLNIPTGKGISSWTGKLRTGKKVTHFWHLMIYGTWQCMETRWLSKCPAASWGGVAGWSHAMTLWLYFCFLVMVYPPQNCGNTDIIFWDSLSFQ